MQDQPAPATVLIVGSNMLEHHLQDFIVELKTVLGPDVPLNYCDIEDEEGSKYAERYDIEPSAVPAILIIENDEGVYKDWYGMDLPDAETIKYEVDMLTGNAE